MVPDHPGRLDEWRPSSAMPGIHRQPFLAHPEKSLSRMAACLLRFRYLLLIGATLMD